MYKKLFDKQKLILKQQRIRWIILSGAVGSGKTYISLLKFVLEVAKSPKEARFLMCGKTLTTLQENCISFLQDKFPNNFNYSASLKKGTLFGRRIRFEGANDKQAQEKIRGFNLTGAYCDEVVTYPKTFMDMLKSRLREPNAFCITTCNPDHPKHWFNGEYRENKELDKVVFDFIIDDNIFLPKKFVENIKKEYTGVLYKRYILGQWVIAEGRIYPEIQKNIVDEVNHDEIMFYSLGIDIGGNKSKTTFILSGFTNQFEKIYIVEEHKINGEQDTIAILNYFKRLFDNYCLEYGNKFKYVVSDSAEQTYLASFNNYKNSSNFKDVEIWNSPKNKITDRINVTCKLLLQDRFFINKNCINVIEALENAHWDDTIELKRADDFSSDIDTLDAMEYSWELFIGQFVN